MSETPKWVDMFGVWPDHPGTDDDQMQRKVTLLEAQALAWRQRAIDTEGHIRDIADRLNRASDALRAKARDAEREGMDFEAARLRGKHEGVRLAWSYVEEYLRAALAASDAPDASGHPDAPHGPGDGAPLPLHRTGAGYPNCSTCDGGGCLDCTDPV